MVVSDDPTSTPPPLTTTPPSPTPVVTPSPTISVSQPVAPTPGGVLQPVGLLPLARGDGSDLDAYYIKVQEQYKPLGVLSLLLLLEWVSLNGAILEGLSYSIDPLHCDEGN